MDPRRNLARWILMAVCFGYLAAGVGNANQPLNLMGFEHLFDEGRAHAAPTSPH